MSIRIKEVGAEQLELYENIPIRFQVESVFRVGQIDGGLSGLKLTEEKLHEPYVKDYDQYDGEKPTRWTKRFDISKWGFFLAFDGNQPVGGIAVAFCSPKVNMLEGRTDLAALWDIRVHPDYRRQGIGTSLFQRASEWAKAKGCRQLKIETQNVNVGACKFYAGQGCQLGTINRYGYTHPPELQHEVMLLWYLAF